MLDAESSPPNDHVDYIFIFCCFEADGENVFILIMEALLDSEN